MNKPSGGRRDIIHEGGRPHQYPGSAGEPLLLQAPIGQSSDLEHTKAQMKSKVLGAGGGNEQEGMVCTRSLGGGSRKPQISRP